MNLPDAPTEDETARDGLLSYAKEWHALIIGFGAGLTAGLTARYELAGIVAAVALGVRGASKTSAPVARNLAKEPWYAFGGLVLGLMAGMILSIL